MAPQSDPIEATGPAVFWRLWAPGYLAPGLNQMLSANLRTTPGRKRQWAAWHSEAAGVVLLGQPRRLRIETPVVVRFRRYYATRPLDAGNLSCKILLDAVVKAGILPDDNPRYVVAEQAQQVKVASVRDVGTLFALVDGQDFEENW